MKELSDKEVLEAAIEKAIDGGWDCFDTDLSKWDWHVAEGRIWPLHMSFTTNESVGLITYTSPVYDLYRIVFNHEFCKALWGENWKLPRTKDAEEIFLEYGFMPHWQYHGTQMFLAEDRIDYLRRHL